MSSPRNCRSTPGSPAARTTDPAARDGCERDVAAEPHSLRLGVVWFMAWFRIAQGASIGQSPVATESSLVSEASIHDADRRTGRAGGLLGADRTVPFIETIFRTLGNRGLRRLQDDARRCRAVAPRGPFGSGGGHDLQADSAAGGYGHERRRALGGAADAAADEALGRSQSLTSPPTLHCPCPDLTDTDGLGFQFTG